MANEYRDPSGDTQAFRAFAQRQEPAAPEPRSVLPYVAGGIAALFILVVVLFLIFA